MDADEVGEHDVGRERLGRREPCIVDCGEFGRLGRHELRADRLGAQPVEAVDHVQPEIAAGLEEADEMRAQPQAAAAIFDHLVAGREHQGGEQLLRLRRAGLPERFAPAERHVQRALRACGRPSLMPR